MAGFLMDISGKDSGQLFSKRLKSDSYEDCMIGGHPDFGFQIVGVDPYTDTMWSGMTLETWHLQLQAQFDDCSERICSEILKVTQKKSYEPWMQKMMQLESRKSEEYIVLKEILKMVETALENNGTIIFLGD